MGQSNPVLRYLGSLLTWNNDCTKDIKARIAKAKGVMAGLNSIWNSKQISYKTKLNVLKTCVFSTALYACEAWTIKKTDHDKILAFEMYCYRRILHLNWTMKVTNKGRSYTVSNEKEIGSVWTYMQNGQ